jgi:hypothetical protein
MAIRIASAHEIYGRAKGNTDLSKASIFISHATPQDNDFVRWLAVRLELSGYTVWHDLARLKGGDYFWDKIEKAIREEACCMLAVVSKLSVDKPGVKDEWALGATLEKTNPGFVIPIRIDDYDFSLLPIGIHRKNVIDFSTGWHKGLSGLLDTFSDANLPRTSQPDPQSTRFWLPELKEGAIVKTKQTESLDSTWLRIISMPPTLETVRFLGKERGIVPTVENRHIPWFEHEDRIVGFATAADLVSLMSKSAMMRKSNAIILENFIETKGDFKFADSDINQKEARKRVLYLMRQAWELAMESKGLGVHMQSGRRKVHYITPELTKGRGTYTPFVDVDGRTRKKALNGRSEKKKASWCFAVGIVPSLDIPRRIELRPTIVFTDDQGNPLEAARAQRVRMSFCRSWYNDKWRAFLRAFLALVSDGKPEIMLPVGSGRFLVVEATPMKFSSPVGLSDIAPPVEADPIVEEEDSEIDLDEDGLDDFEEST